MITSIQQIWEDLQFDLENLTEDLILILGPTASGKTKLAVALAEKLNAEIISVDSRQVYRGMDIGTGKDIAEYGQIPYHLIDILPAGAKYNVTDFLEDFEKAYQAIKQKGKKVIACGGTGFYLHALLEARPYTQIPVNSSLRMQLEPQTKEELLDLLDRLEQPDDLKIDRSSKKRIIRALEIIDFISCHPSHILTSQPTYTAKVIGLNPDLECRRSRINQRLTQRLQEGMIEEVVTLHKSGLSYDDLAYYGLEYKYISLYLQGFMPYAEFVTKLQTEIHRYAKRQMTYFRKMEKDGIPIRWFSS